MLDVINLALPFFGLIFLGYAANVFIMARQYDVWVPQSSSSVLLVTAMSVVTLTTVMWLVKSGLLPHSLFF